jgi:nucleotide-binding universal stress UspA family protein
VHQVTPSVETGHGRRVLVAVDESPRAGAVFDVGAEYAQMLGAELYLLRTITLPPEFPPAAVCSEDDPLPKQLSKIARKQLTDLAKRAPQVEVAQQVITFGFPGHMILQTAHRLQVDLIVLGSHGYKGWDRVLGTTAATIANRSKCNVLVVHADAPIDGKRAEEGHSNP